MHIMRKYWYICALLLLALIVSLSVVVGGWVENQLSPSSPQHSQHTSTSSTKTKPIATSTASSATATNTLLVIPAIGVHAPVEPVGKSATGYMEVPVRNPWTGVGWYQYGPRPGELGSAVLDGHLDRPGGSPAIFWQLHTLHVGDTIMIVQSGKKIRTFRVVQMELYEPKNAPLTRIFSDTAGTFLNLITCAGTWIPQLKQTTQRLVVYSTLVS